jgi:hypothetical protein
MTSYIKVVYEPIKVYIGTTFMPIKVYMELYTLIGMNVTDVLLSIFLQFSVILR